MEQVGIEIIEDINANGKLDPDEFVLMTAYTDASGAFEAELPTGSVTEVVSVVSVYSDDAVQNEPGGIMILDGTQESGVREIGLRFNDIHVPKGAEIISARLKVTAASESALLTEIIISGEASPNPQTFTEANYDIWNRPRTFNTLAWYHNRYRCWPLTV